MTALMIPKHMDIYHLTNMTALESLTNSDEERLKLEQEAEALASQDDGDEPTNHLDLEAYVWLEEMLKKFDRILVVVSHSQDFLNGAEKTRRVWKVAKKEVKERSPRDGRPSPWCRLDIAEARPNAAIAGGGRRRIGSAAVRREMMLAW
eukprot:Gb_41636 [translate_table: standard]